MGMRHPLEKPLATSSFLALQKTALHPGTGLPC